jgi:L-lactate dehydrogenase (cytochrome)
VATRNVATTPKVTSFGEGLGQRKAFLVKTGCVTAAVALAIYLGDLLTPIAMDSDPDSQKKSMHSTVQPSGQKLISAEEVAKHNTRDDCWVIISGQVYDVTEFLDQHPGGAKVILQQAGDDATEVFKPLHPPGVLEENLRPDQCLGPIDPTTVKTKAPRPLTEDERRIRNAREEMPPIDAMINLYDFEIEAEKVLSKTAWAYYRSAANGEDTYRENEEAWNRYWFRPRVLRDVTHIDPSSKMLDMPVTLPIYVAPAAMAKLGHPLGEVNITRAAGKAGIIQGISSNASCSLEEMVEAAQPGQNLIFQLYLNKDRKASERLIKKVDALGCKAIMFTVDSARSGFRELDVRAKGVPDAPPPSAADDTAEKSQAPVGIAQAISGYQDPNLTWDDLNFIRKHTKLPIIIKGIQCVEDVELAAQHGAAGVILSNHGGRSLNFAPAPIDVLYEMRHTKPELFDKLEVYVDSGVRRGTDVVKALALGATAVGLGRPFLYGNGTYGEEGCAKVYELMYNEVVTAMALVGARNLSELKPEMVRPRGWMPEAARK